MTNDVSNKLVELGIKYTQVTLDGPKDIHDKTRYLVNGNGTYEHIIKNLKSINRDLNVAIRVNLQKENIKYVPDCIQTIYAHNN